MKLATASPHYLVAAVGSTGDMHPFMSLALALQGMGRRVSFMGPAFHADLLQKAGIPFIGLGTEADYLRIIANPNLWHPLRGFKALFGHYREPLVESFHALMAFRSQEPLTIIGHPFALPAIAMARESGLEADVVATYLAPTNLRTVHDPLNLGQVNMPGWVPLSWRKFLWQLLDRVLVDPHAATALNQARADVGLPAIRQSFLPHMQSIADLSVTLFPPWFAATQPDWPRPLLAGDFPLYDATAHEPFSPALAEFLAAGTPPVVVTPGTGNAHAGELFNAATQALSRLGRRAVFLSRHREQIPAALPPDILWQPYVALSRLLPQAAAPVHHGGIGTTAEALRAGVPQIVTPFAWDQFDNAARLKALGVAQAVAASRMHAEKLQYMLSEVLGSADMHANCRRWARQFETAPAAETLCREIENALQIGRL